MTTDKNEQLRQLQKKIILLQVVGTIGTVMLALGLSALGLFGKFGARSNELIPIFNNRDYAYGFIAIGAIIMVWEFIAIIPLFRKRAELAKGGNG